MFFGTNEEEIKIFNEKLSAFLNRIETIRILAAPRSEHCFHRAKALQIHHLLDLSGEMEPVSIISRLKTRHDQFLKNCDILLNIFNVREGYIEYLESALAGIESKLEQEQNMPKISKKLHDKTIDSLIKKLDEKRDFLVRIQESLSSIFRSLDQKILSLQIALGAKDDIKKKEKEIIDFTAYIKSDIFRTFHYFGIPLHEFLKEEF